MKTIVYVLFASISLVGCWQTSSAQALNPEVFNSAVYANIYVDLRSVYGSGLDGTGNPSAITDHWQFWGLPQEGRRASIIFDPRYYLDRYPDLRTAFGTDYAAALNHFLTWGLAVEGRRGSLEFDVQFYLANNPDLAAAFGMNGYQAAANHFLTQGWPYEGRQGSADFAIKTYLSNYPDVSSAYGANDYYDAMLHWLRRGKAWGRAGLPVFAINGDCSDSVVFNPPSLRIYIAFRTDGNPGTGTHADPYDGSTADKFDAILRSRSESGQANQVVCIGPGTFSTRGSYDWVIGCQHTTANCSLPPSSQTLGFTLNQGWRVHGSGIDVTTLKLVAFIPVNPQVNPFGFPPLTGSGVVIGTHDDGNNGISVTDLTIDDNYSFLKGQATSMGISAINLQAVQLRGKGGNNTIDHIKVINAAAEIANGDIRFEGFPVLIIDATTNADPGNNPNNMIQFVTMSNFRGGKCTAIALGNVQANVRFNTVNGYQIGFGGWNMRNVNFTDNFTVNTIYGFNDDSLSNDHVTIQFNEFIHPLQFGVVIGGPAGQFSNFTVVYNNMNLNNNNITGLLLRGQVTNLLFGRNNMLPDTPPSLDYFYPPQNVVAFAGANISANSIFQDNLIFSGFLPTPISATTCVYSTRDETSVQRADFPNTQSSPCVTPF